MKRFIAIAALLAAACAQPTAPEGEAEAATGIEAFFPKGAAFETLGEGYVWTEGPVWTGDALLFSDVPSNKVHRWAEGEGASVYLDPSGLDIGADPALVDGGINGMTMEGPGVLLAADHRGRNIARIDLATKKRTVLAERFEGKRFNSCNDLVRAADGAIYFTDPPYGLKGGNESSLKELDFNGVFRLAPDGTVTAIDKTLSWPNGIALSPDGKTLYVANSDPERAIWMMYEVQPDGSVANGRVMHDATDRVKAGADGLPDGLRVTDAGLVFATGPGGVYVFEADGTLRGVLPTPAATANLAFGGPDGTTLFLTSSDKLLRVETTVRGFGLTP